MTPVSFLELVQAMSALPQIIESVKSMSAAEMESFLGQLGLEGQGKEDAINILTAFQEGKTLSPEEQMTAQNLLDKALTMNKLDLDTLMSLNLGNYEQT